MKELNVEEEDKHDKHKPDKDKIIKIYMADDYGILYLTFTIVATICILLFLMKMVG